LYDESTLVALRSKRSTPRERVLEATSHRGLGVIAQKKIKTRISKSEIVSFSEGEDRNQYQMTKIQMTETVVCDIRFGDCDLACLFLTLEHYGFEFVSDFDIRPALARLYWAYLCYYCYIVPERKVVFRLNPNIEIRNSKQIRISNDKMPQTNTLGTRCFCHWDIRISVIVSGFVLRISKFLPKERGFRSSTN